MLQWMVSGTFVIDDDRHLALLAEAHLARLANVADAGIQSLALVAIAPVAPSPG